ncbi:MAG: SCO family protein [Burkholderiales bacterium]
MSPYRIAVWVVVPIALLLGVVAAYTTVRSSERGARFEAVDITGSDWGRGFELTDHHGTRRTLGDFRGKIVMLFFGYTNCPDMCPTTLALLATAVKQLSEEDARDVQVLFVTVDPKRDTPEILARYVPAFHPGFLGLHSDPETTARTAREFKAFFELRPPNEYGSYSVDHSGQVFVFDPQGRLRLFVRPEAAPEAIVHDVRKLLAEAGA